MGFALQRAVLISVEGCDADAEQFTEFFLGKSVPYPKLTNPLGLDHPLAVSVLSIGYFIGIVVGLGVFKLLATFLALIIFDFYGDYFSPDVELFRLMHKNQRRLFLVIRTKPVHCFFSFL